MLPRKRLGRKKRLELARRSKLVNGSRQPRLPLPRPNGRLNVLRISKRSKSNKNEKPKPNAGEQRGLVAVDSGEPNLPPRLNLQLPVADHPLSEVLNLLVELVDGEKDLRLDKLVVTYNLPPLRHRLLPPLLLRLLLPLPCRRERRLHRHLNEDKNGREGRRPVVEVVEEPVPHQRVRGVVPGGRSSSRYQTTVLVGSGSHSTSHTCMSIRSVSALSREWPDWTAYGWVHSAMRE